MALPSKQRPIVVAEAEPWVLRYVRTALLATPPRSAAPAWLYTAARHALRVPGAWHLAPCLTVRPPDLGTPTNRNGSVVSASESSPSRVETLIAESGASLLALDHSHNPDARVVLLLFAPHEYWPMLALKVPSGPEAAARVLIEADQLRTISALPLGAVAPTVPKVVRVLHHGSLPVMVTTAQPGVPMLVAYHRSGHTARPACVREDLDSAAAWLASLQSATAGDTAPLDIAPGTVAALVQRLAGDPDAGDRVLGLVAALRRRLRHYSAPRTVVHGDFWPGNVLVRHGRVCGVVDWEWAETAGSPTRDLARFARGYSEYLDRHTGAGHGVRGHPGVIAGVPGAGVAYALDGSGWYPQLIHRFLTAGLERLGLPGVVGRDAVLAELVAVAAEATDEQFARRQLQAFEHLATGVAT
ncbi:phosphotransferase family protein [Streptomyces sp. A30]|uniref:phosphotransferase family protein n=1 Tax=Streptomyces sp. A30 TaxID=2789273 RepID=UPI0039801F53